MLLLVNVDFTCTLDEFLKANEGDDNLTFADIDAIKALEVGDTYWINLSEVKRIQ